LPERRKSAKIQRNPDLIAFYVVPVDAGVALHATNLAEQRHHTMIGSEAVLEE
jgi:hypothetical protein